MIVFSNNFLPLSQLAAATPGRGSFNNGTTPVDGGNFEKVLDILVEHPQLVTNELSDELHMFCSKLTCKTSYFMRLGDIDFMLHLKY